MRSRWTCLSTLAVLGQNGAHSRKSESLLFHLSVSTHRGTGTPRATNALQAFVLIFPDTLGMPDVLACLGSSSHDGFSE